MLPPASAADAKPISELPPMRSVSPGNGLLSVKLIGHGATLACVLAAGLATPPGCSWHWRVANGLPTWPGGSWTLTFCTPVALVNPENVHAMSRLGKDPGELTVAGVADRWNGP